MADDCCDCVYGDEFLDDGVPHRFILKICARCTELSAKALDFLAGHVSQRQGADSGKR